MLRTQFTREHVSGACSSLASAWHNGRGTHTNKRGRAPCHALTRGGVSWRPAAGGGRRTSLAGRALWEATGIPLHSTRSVLEKDVARHSSPGTLPSINDDTEGPSPPTFEYKARTHKDTIKQ